MVVMASTEETDSSAISSSTRSRSTLTRSKISLAVKAWPSLPIRMRLSSVAQTQPFKIPGCYGSQLLGRNPADLRQFARRLHQKRRLIALAAMRDRGQIRRVCLDQQSVQGRQPRRFANCLGLGERQHPAKAQVESEIEALLRFRRSTR